MRILFAVRAAGAGLVTLAALGAARFCAWRLGRCVARGGAWALRVRAVEGFLGRRR